jgi:hypothetical protein
MNFVRKWKMSKNTEKSANAGEMQNKEHLWKKGESGNPAGKKPGTRHKATLAVERLLDGEGEGLTRKAIELALEGDLTALRLCLERICPPKKSRPVNIQLPNSKTADGVAEAQAVVVQGVGEGELTPEEGQVLANILEARRRSIETEDHERRLYELEKEIKKGRL